MLLIRNEFLKYILKEHKFGLSWKKRGDDNRLDWEPES